MLYGRSGRRTDRKDHMAGSAGIGESRTALTFLLLINVETPQKEKIGQSDRSQMQGKEWRWLSQQVVIITILNRVFLLNTPNRLFKNKMD